MSGVVHLLNVSITSALAIKPSTVYVLHVENTKTKDSWHIRRCFSDFCELREKLVALLDGQNTVGGVRSTNGSTDYYCTNSERDSSGSASSPAISKNPLKEDLERFSFLYKQFPRRHFFGLRSKRVIEQRTTALNQFLHQALNCVKEIKRTQQIALYFSFMTTLEAFFDCANHKRITRHQNGDNEETISPSTIARTNAAIASMAGLHHYPVAPATSFKQTTTHENEITENQALESGTEDENMSCNFDFTYLFNREYAQQNDANDTEDEDADKEMEILKKASSAMLHRELSEIRLHYTGGHYARMETTSATKMSPADAWAARIKIAGIYPAVNGLRVPDFIDCHQQAVIEYSTKSPQVKLLDTRDLDSRRQLATEDRPEWA